MRTVEARPSERQGGGTTAPPSRRRPAENAPAVRRPRLRRPRAAVVAWRDVTIPRLGRIPAIAWAPTIILGVLFMALVYLIQTSGVATSGYDIQRLQTEERSAVQRNDQLNLELAKLRSLAWVESEAVGRLGMQRPSSVEYMPGSTQTRS